MPPVAALSESSAGVDHVVHFININDARWRQHIAMLYPSRGRGMQLQLWRWNFLTGTGWHRHIVRQQYIVDLFPTLVFPSYQLLQMDIEVRIPSRQADDTSENTLLPSMIYIFLIIIHRGVESTQTLLPLLLDLTDRKCLSSNIIRLVHRILNAF